MLNFVRRCLKAVHNWFSNWRNLQRINTLYSAASVGHFLHENVCWLHENNLTSVSEFNIYLTCTQQQLYMLTTNVLNHSSFFQVMSKTDFELILNQYVPKISLEHSTILSLIQSAESTFSIILCKRLQDTVSMK